METKKEFIDSFVKIEELEDGGFGYYPFNMICVNKDGSREMYALALGGQIAKVYKYLVDKIKTDPKKIFLAVDFPGQNGAKLDTVVVYEYNNIEDINLSLIPYDPVTGEVLPEILASDLITMFQGELQKAIKHFS